jgi:hypothetical protein
MEKLVFDNDTHLYIGNYDITNIKDEVLAIANKFISDHDEVKTDGYTFYIGRIKTTNHVEIEINNNLEFIRNFGINSCIDLYTQSGNPHNLINADCWVNVVRAKNPVQKNYRDDDKLIFHNHVEINELNKMPKPTYTFVYYIQMPNNLSGDDGVLFVKGKNGNVYSYLPKEGDIIIMDGDLPHVPNYALNSTLDRIVLAGNVGIEYSKLNNTLI